MIMPSRYRGPADHVRALDAYVKLARAASAVERAVNDHLADADLTPSQFGVLEALHHLGPQPQGVLARKILTSPANLTTVLDKLQRRALIRRSRDAGDRRVVRIDLTPDGEALVADLLPRHAQRAADAFAALTADEQSELARLLRIVGRAQADPSRPDRAGPPHAPARTSPQEAP